LAGLEGRDPKLGAESILALMKAVDGVHSDSRSVRSTRAFLMPIEDVFSISGRGTVVTGRIERGVIKVGEEVEIIGVAADDEDGGDGRGRCSASCWTRARRATTSGALLARHQARGVERGQVLAKPGSITPHTKFKAEAYILTKEEGGRHTPFFSNYRRSSTSARRT